MSDSTVRTAQQVAFAAQRIRASAERHGEDYESERRRFNSLLILRKHAPHGQVGTYVRAQEREAIWRRVRKHAGVRHLDELTDEELVAAVREQREEEFELGIKALLDQDEPGVTGSARLASLAESGQFWIATAQIAELPLTVPPWLLDGAR
ncbi:hypothetical protein [Kitasatospora viridis]|uniref:Uncharacterized protein n=1 Tax=Kitasatospora viridis TaxID=281105 RepID=A0A561S9Z1_9ACTN|nr:hypothetical protein [Kitasatospora viridis]TWF71698.1 hypothetical protein FHX73_1869 [Kitasatospora viridis]